METNISKYLSVIFILDIKTSDLLSILLALFAIGLSVAFYIKANDVSNKFYDNMYKFTKDNSELLGRMEAGFSEQLRHLNQGYSGLNDKLNKLPFDFVKTREKVEEEKAEVEMLKKEKLQLLNEFATKANLENSEKEELFNKLKESELKLNRAENALRELQHKLRHADESNANGNSENPQLISYTKDRVLHKLNIESIENTTDEDLANSWNLIRDELNRLYILDLRKSGMIDISTQLTEKGLKFFRSFFNLKSHL